jgi:hypothetical protein
VWADKAVQRLNALYSLDRTSLDQLGIEMENARQNWQEFEQALLTHLPDSRFDALLASLEAEKSTLSRNIGKLNQIDLLVSDVRLMEAGLQDLRPADSLPLVDLLGLISLQQRAVEGAGLVQVQITDVELARDDYTVGSARARLELLVSSLQAQKIEVEGIIQATERRISQTAVDLESSGYQIAELKIQRDLARRAYEALAGQEQAILLAVSQNDQLVRQAGSVMPPLSPEGGRMWLYAVGGGAAGFLASALSVLLLHWWRSPLEQPRADQEKAEAVSTVK